MARKSRKPSGTKAEWLLSTCTFFADRCLGKSVGIAPRDAGLKVEFHADHFADDADDDIANRIDHAVAGVAESDGRLAIPLDHDRQVLDNLPDPFNRHGHDEPADRPEPSSERPEQCVKQQTVLNVGETVRVDKMLRIVCAVGVARPEHEPPAPAPEAVPLEPERHRRQPEDRPYSEPDSETL
jgi:hypothetical protein